MPRYEWYAAGKPIKGAIQAVFVVRRAEHGKRITVRVTGSKDGYRTVTRISKATRRAV